MWLEKGVRSLFMTQGHLPRNASFLIHNIKMVMRCRSFHRMKRIIYLLRLFFGRGGNCAEFDIYRESCCCSLSVDYFVTKDFQYYDLFHTTSKLMNKFTLDFSTPSHCMRGIRRTKAIVGKPSKKSRGPDVELSHCHPVLCLSQDTLFSIRTRSKWYNCTRMFRVSRKNSSISGCVFCCRRSS